LSGLLKAVSLSNGVEEPRARTGRGGSWVRANAQLRVIAIDEPLARQAGDLAAQHALRGYDAVHLACALHLQGDDVLLATWDNALNSAARATGQLIANDTG
jgi:uncharacterized protein